MASPAELDDSKYPILSRTKEFIIKGDLKGFKESMGIPAEPTFLEEIGFGRTGRHTQAKQMFDNLYQTLAAQEIEQFKEQLHTPTLGQARAAGFNPGRPTSDQMITQPTFEAGPANASLIERPIIQEGPRPMGMVPQEMAAQGPGNAVPVFGLSSPSDPDIHARGGQSLTGERVLPGYAAKQPPYFEEGPRPTGIQYTPGQAQGPGAPQLTGYSQEVGIPSQTETIENPSALLNQAQKTAYLAQGHKMQSYPPVGNTDAAYKEASIQQVKAILIRQGMDPDQAELQARTGFDKVKLPGSAAAEGENLDNDLKRQNLEKVKAEVSNLGSKLAADLQKTLAETSKIRQDVRLSNSPEAQRKRQLDNEHAQANIDNLRSLIESRLKGEEALKQRFSVALDRLQLALENQKLGALATVAASGKVTDEGTLAIIKRIADSADVTLERETGFFKELFESLGASGSFDVTGTGKPVTKGMNPQGVSSASGSSSIVNKAAKPQALPDLPDPDQFPEGQVVKKGGKLYKRVGKEWVPTESE